MGCNNLPQSQLIWYFFYFTEQMNLLVVCLHVTCVYERY